MLTAQYLNERIVAPDADRDSVKSLSRDGLLRCPACDREVVFHAGMQKAWHFKHKAKTSDCPFGDDPDYHPESELYVQLKMALRDWALAQFPPDRHPGVTVDLEVHVPETGQFADVMLTLPREEKPPIRVALEVQCSLLTGSEWRARAARYAEAGVLDVWLLAGPKHTNQGVAGQLVLRDLPGSILQDRGRVLLAHAAADELKEDGKDSVAVQVLHGLATRYAGLHAPVDYVETYHERHVSQQPAYLGDQKPWGTRRGPVATFDLQQDVHFESPLPPCWLDPEAATPERVFWVGDEHRAADERARAWERANEAWHAAWKPRRAAYERDQAARRADERRQADADLEAAVREVNRLVGETVAAALPDLFPAVFQLAKEGGRTSNERALRRRRALPDGVKKWPTAFWTPFADLDVPLEWVFGVDRRVWQMAVYAYVMSAMYTTSFRRRHRIDVKGFDVVATGYALKALGAVNLLHSPSARRVDRAVGQINSRVDEIARAHAPLLTQDQGGHLVVTIAPHRIRHLVVGAYFASLASHSFLRGPHYCGLEPGLRRVYPGGYDGAAGAEPGPAFRALDRLRRWLLVLGRRGPEAVRPEALGAAWLDLARRISTTETGQFSFVTPLLPPFFDREETAAALREGIRDRTIRVFEREVRVAGTSVYRSPVKERPRYRSGW